MSADIESHVRELLDRAAGMPEGAAKRATFDEAIATADTHRHDQLGYDARMAALWSIYENGDVRLLFVHYAWCLAASDRNPDWDRYQLLWQYRWVIDSMPHTPDIPRPQIEEALADMTRRYAADGFTDRAVVVLKRRVYENLGDHARETAAFAAIRTCGRDRMSDDRNSEAKFDLEHYLFHKRHADAAQFGERLLANLPQGDRHAGSTRAELIVPLLALGEWDRAAEYHRVGLKVNARLNRRYSTFRGHVLYLTAVGDLAGATALTEKYLPEADGRSSVLSQFEFFQVVRFLCGQLARAGGTPTLTVPGWMGVPAAVGRATVADFAAYLDAETAAIARHLDSRNGNGHYQQRLPEDLTEWTELADRTPPASPTVPVAAPAPPPPRRTPDPDKVNRRR